MPVTIGVTDETQDDSWVFEDRTKTVGVKTVISWRQEMGNGALDILPRSRLIDNDTKLVLVEDTHATPNFTVESTPESHAYIFEYLGQQRPKPKTFPWLHLLL